MDKKIFDELIEQYKKELEDLEKARLKRSIERSNMTEEELVQSIASDLEEVKASVDKNRTNKT